jgi:choline dehydrogenase-like flavoprotein
MREHFEGSARVTALALAHALLPGGAVFRPADEETISRFEQILSSYNAGAISRFGALLAVLENAPRLTHRGRGFSKLSSQEAETFLASWSDADVGRRTLILALTAPLKVAYFDDPAIYKHHGCTWRFEQRPEKPRWMDQVTRGAELGQDTELECDVVVVGTGAGGAVAAKELAERGHAVLMLEEGEFHTRERFTGAAIDAFQSFYQQRGLLGSFGNTVIPIPAGRMVGGSTAINTGTCWRTPNWILDRWVEEGLTDFSPDQMAPYFERVEHELQVAPADWKYLGGAARVVARGADLLGYSHYPVRRNAPACDGSGICDFGCPTDARRSTNVSYVPEALKLGAALFTGVRAERVMFEGSRVTGLEARTVAGGHFVTIRAKAVVLSCGALNTPVFLQQQGLDKGLDQVGRNLSLHPATMVSALFDEDIRGYAAIPQGYCVDEFQRSEGILLLGASAPIDLAAAQFVFVGSKLMEVMEAYNRVASFGVMVEDASRGRVTSGKSGRPRVFYWLGKEEQHRLKRGTEILSRIFLAGGAREVYPAMHGHRVIKSSADLAKLAYARPGPGDWLLTAFHPLGTCRMATSADHGVVSTDHEVFGLPGLYIMDGSAVPSSLAVNPQVTIMAMATRAAQRLADRLDGSARMATPLSA